MAESLSGVKVLFVIAPSAFDGEELSKARKPLEAAGATIVLSSPPGGEAVSASGEKVLTIPITEPRTTEMSALVVIGGTGALPHLADNGLVHKTIRMVERDGKPVGGLSFGAVVLAKAGVLTGKPATTWVTPESLKALKEGGAKFEKKPVVIAGPVITADGAGSADRFGALFVDLLTASRARSSSGRVVR